MLNRIGPSSSTDDACGHDVVEVKFSTAFSSFTSQRNLRISWPFSRKDGRTARLSLSRILPCYEMATVPLSDYSKSARALKALDVVMASLQGGTRSHH